MSIIHTREMLESLQNTHGVEAGTRLYSTSLTEMLSPDPATGKPRIRPEQVSLRETALALFGPKYFDVFERGSTVALREAGEVASTAFLHISGQLIFSKVMEGYNEPSYLLHPLLDRIPTKNLRGEKIPAPSAFGPLTNYDVEEATPYKKVQFTEWWVETPELKKQSIAVELTREAVVQDRAGFVLTQAKKVGQLLARVLEERVLNLILGIDQTYNENGTAKDTYYTDGDAGPWINSITGNEFIDWTNVDTAMQLFAEMKDPTSAYSILVDPRHILVMPYKFLQARRVLYLSQEIGSTSGSRTTVSDNPLTGLFGPGSLFTSPLAYQTLLEAEVEPDDAKKTWFIGDFTKAFAVMEGWPLEVLEASPDNSTLFERDLFAIYKATQMNIPVILDPRYIVKCTA